jgi:parallel beta-helix repeat protein
MNMRNKYKPVILGLLLAFSAIVIVNNLDEVAATNRYVGGGGTPNYATITQALAASSSGDTIYVAYGTYNENIDIQISINIVGVMSGPNRPVISSSNNNDPIIDIINTDINVIIRNFEIDGNGGNSVAGIRSSITPADTLGVEIDNCVIHGMSGTGSGIKLYNNANSHWIHDCNIYSNYNGITMNNSDSNLVEDCVIHNNQNDGIYVYGDENDFEDNTINDNGYCGIELYDSWDCLIASSYYGNTEIYDNEYGIYASYCDDLTVIGSANVDYLCQVLVHNNTNRGISTTYCDDLQVSYTSTNDNGDDTDDGFYSYQSEHAIMDHVLFWDSMTLYNCSKTWVWWAISYYHILSPSLTLCGNITWSNPI